MMLKQIHRYKDGLEKIINDLRAELSALRLEWRTPHPNKACKVVLVEKDHIYLSKIINNEWHYAGPIPEPAEPEDK